MTDSATPDAAAVLYGSTPPAPTPGDAGSGAAATTAPAATAPASPAPASGAAPPPDHSDETLDAADVLFGDPAIVARSYEPTLSDSLDDLTALAPELSEKRGELLSNAAEIFSDARIPPENAATLHSLYVNTLRNPPSDDATQDWARESTEWLKANYPQGYASALNRVRQYVHSRPDLKLALENTRLGDHPQVVKALIENASQLRLAPRKKK